MQKKVKKYEQNKGIALITLLVAILMMLIISSIILYNTTSHIRVQNLNNMYNDIRLLSEQVFLYYSKYNELPIINEEYAFELDSIILQDYTSDKFNVIDIDKIDRNIKSNLNYGNDYYQKKYEGTEKYTDVYIINTETHQIFYVKGIELDERRYYTIPNENTQYKKMDTEIIFANPPELKSNLSAIKYNTSENRIIPISSYDESWYNYSRSEDLNNWARAKITDNEMFMWIPRYSYNISTKEIVFLKGKTDNPIEEGKNISGEDWRIPAGFKDEDGNKLSGVWLNIGDDYYEITTKDELILAVNDLVGKDNTSNSTNTTVTGKQASYYNPIIPAGFRTVQTDTASWRSNDGIHVNGWNEGLVIEDKDGNQFVWVPVDGADVEYKKWCTSGRAYEICKDDVILSNTMDEKMQIEKYSGFYVARYEAGIPKEFTNAINDISQRNVRGKPVSKKNQIPWNFIDYTNSKNNAESMYNTTLVKSGLITGTQWDTIIKWYANSGINIEDNRSWSNVGSSEVTGVTEYSTNSEADYGANWIKSNIEVTKHANEFWLIKTGNTDYTQQKNIYDIGGSLYEWSNERIISSSNPVPRGGIFSYTTYIDASFRGTNPEGTVNNYFGFRCVLYVL